jgi:hypothetical protein
VLLNIVIGGGFLLLGALRARPAVRGRASGQGGRRALEPPLASTPPIEQIAADLRRSLWRHDALVTAEPDSGRSVGQIRAMEVAISERAVQAARALDVRHPEPPMFGPLEIPRLRTLLRDLAAAGLVLPLQVHLLGVDPAH